MSFRTSSRRDRNTDLCETFTSLSESEKAQINESYQSFPEEIQRELISISSDLRPGEGQIFKTAVSRYKSVLQPVSSTHEGVHIPLDVSQESGTQISIWIPENLESYADSAILAELFRYKAHVRGVKLLRAEGTIPDNRPGNWFVMGYITELLSSQAIKQIRYSKDSPYSLGRSCARVKLLMSCIDQQKIPSSYLRIPDRFLGGIAQFKEPEVSRALKTYFTAEDAKHIERMLQTLSSHLVRVDREAIEKKLDESLFSPVEIVVNMAKRHVKTTEKSSRGRSRTVVQAVTPTRPSQLATVAKWEKSMITELYEQPWDREQMAIEDFNKIPYLQRNYVEFRKELSVIFEKQWSSKQSILRATTHRLATYPGNRDDPLYRKLNWIRDTLRQYGSIDQIPSSDRADFDPNVLIPLKSITIEGVVHTFSSYLRSETGTNRYPSTAQLLAQWEGLQTASAESPDST